MRPPAESPGNASRREQKKEVTARRKTIRPMSKKLPINTGERHSRSGPGMGTQQRKAKGREAKRRCRGRGRGHNPSQPRGRTWKGGIGSSWSPSSSLSLSRGEGGDVDARRYPRNRGRSGGSNRSLSERRRRPHRRREKEEWKCRSSSRGSYYHDEKEEHKEECVYNFSWDDEGDSASSSRRIFSANFGRGEASRSHGDHGCLAHVVIVDVVCFPPLNLGKRRFRARSTKSCY